MTKIYLMKDDPEKQEVSKKPETRKLGRTILVRGLEQGVKLWLRSQVDGIEGLKVRIEGQDSNLLQGYILRIHLFAQQAIYQGLHLTQVELEASNIRINIGQVLKGQPLGIIEPVPILGQVQLSQANLQASCTSPLLNNALKDLLTLILAQNNRRKYPQILANQEISWQNIEIKANYLKFDGYSTSSRGKRIPIVITTGFKLLSPYQLCLDPLHIEFPPEILSFMPQSLELDLGKEAQIQEISLLPGLLFCQGGLVIKP